MTEQGGYAFIAPVQRWFERAFGEPTHMVWDGR